MSESSRICFDPSFDGQIGLARLEITPELDIYARTWGSSVHDFATGVHRPLFVTAIAFTSKDTDDNCFLVTLDLCAWRSLSDEQFVRRPALESLNLDESQLIIALSHTHSAPVTDRQYRDRPGGDRIEPYLEFVAASVIDCCKAALSNVNDSHLSWGVGQCNLAASRIFEHSDTKGVSCGFNPVSDADTTLLVGRITDNAGRVVGTIINYACHPTTLGGGNTLFSPDYVGATREIVERATGGAICTFLLGAAGDLSPRFSYQDDPEFADKNGEQLGYSALSVLHGMLPAREQLQFSHIERSGTELAIWSLQTKGRTINEIICKRDTVQLKIASIPTAAEYKAMINMAEDKVEKERLERRYQRRLDLGENEFFDFPYYVWVLGQMVVVGVPIEALSSFQITLRSRYPNLAIITMNIANGHIGYLPSTSDFEKDSYEVSLCFFAKGSLESLEQSCAATIDDLIKRRCVEN